MKRWLVAACSGILLAQAACVLAQASVPLQATSDDGRWRVAAEGGAVAVHDEASGQRAKSLRAVALDGTGPSAVAAIHHAAPRRSFIIAFETLPELWELSHDPRAEPIYDGMVHDYKMGEGIAIPGFLNPRRTRLDVPLRSMVFDSSHAFVLARAPDRTDGQAVLHLIQLDVRRRIAEFTLRGDPDVASAQRIVRAGRELLEVPDRRGGVALVVDPRAARRVDQ